MTRLAIIADDLTGALDAAAPFAVRGIRTTVALGVDGLDAALASGADVVGVSTDSREIAPDMARRAVADCVVRLPQGLPIFKKVDSRLKGNIEAELDALSFTRALVSPAIPAFGRFVRHGQLLGFGVSTPIDIAQGLGRHASAATIPDATSQAEIEGALQSVQHDLKIGARSLAEAMAASMVPNAAEPTLPAITGPAICVIGSTDPITLAQLSKLRSGAPNLAYIAAPDGTAPQTLHAPAALTVLQATLGTAGTASALVAQRLGQSLLRLAPQPGTTLLISGGATAQVVLQALGITSLDLLGEALPGLPIARAGGFTIITKSGGFGDSDALLHLLGHLGGAEQGS